MKKPLAVSMERSKQLQQQQLGHLWLLVPNAAELHAGCSTSSILVVVVHVVVVVVVVNIVILPYCNVIIITTLVFFV